MNKPQRNQSKLRRFRSYTSLTISISLVLFLLGLISMLLLNANRFSDYIQEHIGFTIMLQEKTQESDALRLQKKLSALPFTRQSNYVDKEDAAKQLEVSLGEDFIDLLGSNPLYSSIDLKLQSEYLNEDSIQVIEATLMEYPEVKEVHYQKDIVHVIESNVQKVSVFLASLTILLLLVFIALINNTVTLSMRNQRFTINTMKLVGATRGFIRAPFIKQSLIAGVLGALLACLFILIIFNTYQANIDSIFKLNTLDSIIISFGIILIFGVLISSISTYFAVNKYLRMKYEELF